MSKNRKRRLKRLASAILGAVSMTGMDATPTAAREVPQERGWNWPAIGVGTAGIIGATGLGLTAYSMFGRKSAQELVAEEQFKVLQDANKKRLEDEQYKEKVKQIKLKHGLTDAGVTNMVANFNALRPGMPALVNDDVLANLDKQAVQDLIKTASNASNAANHKALLKEIVKKIQEEVTPEKLDAALAKLCDGSDKENIVGEDALVTYKGEDGTAAVSIDNFIPNPGLDDFQDLNIGGVIAEFKCVGKVLTALKGKQREAGDCLLPDDLKGLLSTAMPIALVTPALKSDTQGEGAGWMLGGGDAGGLGFLNTNRARTRVAILDNYVDEKMPLQGIQFAQGHYMGVSLKRALAGQLPTDILIGPQIQSTAAGAAVPANTLANMLGLHTRNNAALKKIKEGDYKKIYKNIYGKIKEILNED